MDQNFKSEFQKSVHQTRSFLKWIILALVILYFSSGIFSIKTNELGVLQRFGKVVDAGVLPGIHFSLPWPIDKVSRVPVKEVKRIFIDDFYEEGQNADLFYRFTGLPSNCITGDNNIVTLNCVLQYTIANPAEYLFNVNQIDIILRSLACNTIIHCLAQISVDETMTYGKKSIETYVKQKLQYKLNELRSGINISFVELKDVRPPAIVQHYFDDVINAKIDKRKMISKAESYKNEKLPNANAQATRLLSAAEAYKNKVIAEATGETKRFLSQLEEYQKNPTIARHRLYFDFVRNVFPSLENKIIVDGDSIDLRLMRSGQ